MMVTTIGIDPHKATHTAVAIDDRAVGPQARIDRLCSSLQLV
jgi:hypothetical protein